MSAGWVFGSAGSGFALFSVPASLWGREVTCSVKLEEFQACVCSSVVPWHILPSILEEGSSWQRPLWSLLAHSWACCPVTGAAA